MMNSEIWAGVFHSAFPAPPSSKSQKVASAHPGAVIKVKTEGERFLTSDQASLLSRRGEGGAAAAKSKLEQMEPGGVCLK